MPKLKPLFLSGFVGPGGANEPGAVLLNQPGRRGRRSPAVPDTLHFYMFTGIEHFAIASPNPKGLADWYVEKLGFEQCYEYDGNFFVRAQDGGMIEIIPSEGARPETAFRTEGLRHIAISVKNFDEAHTELQRKNVEFLGAPYENQGNRLVFFKDRDGNLVHLIQRQKPLP
jgi:glyoxylase I family protein